MIKITIFKDSGKLYRGFEFSGHAEYAEYGADIVCASVSVLVINTINAIEAFTEDKFTLDQEEDDGLIQVEFMNPISEQTKLLMDTLMLGLSNISDEYGTEFVQVIFKEV